MAVAEHLHLQIAVSVALEAVKRYSLAIISARRNPRRGGRCWGRHGGMLNVSLRTICWRQWCVFGCPEKAILHRERFTRRHKPSCPFAHWPVLLQHW